MSEQKEKNTEQPKKELSLEEIEARRKAMKQRKLYKKKRKRAMIMLAGAAVLAIVILVAGGVAINNAVKLNKERKIEAQKKIEEEARKKEEREKLLAQAETVAMGYDYDGAIAFLQTVDNYTNDTEITTRIAKYEEAKLSLVPFSISDVTHVFFHTLINDCDKVFDGDHMEKGYNQVMTTCEEFSAIMQSMYDKGYVLVELTDMAGYVTNADGSVTWQEGQIMLPAGKKAFVLSQDDVCYYEYMEPDGYPSRLLIGEDGNITNEVIQDDGSKIYGSYDVVPMLEDFIKEHPDFSYKGARGYLAFTGYDGILGYRTAPKYIETLGAEEQARQIEEAKKVANRLIEQGWEFASHSWGHRYYGQISYSDLREDAQKWEEQVRPILENNGTYKCDTLIYAFGDDIASWPPYDLNNEKFAYLKGLGFNYFCNVDSNPTWVQNNNELQYLRQGRRNLDGQRMYKDMVNSGSDYLSDLFDVNEVFDKRRPTPVL